MKQAILIEYDYCSGCHSCEIACQQVHDLGPGKFGVKLAQIGPDEVAPRRWQLDNVPLVTERCDYCASRRQEGKRPLCEQSCQSGCIKVGPLSELADYAESHGKTVIFSR